MFYCRGRETFIKILYNNANFKNFQSPGSPKLLPTFFIFMDIGDCCHFTPTPGLALDRNKGMGIEIKARGRFEEEGNLGH